MLQLYARRRQLAPNLAPILQIRLLVLGFWGVFRGPVWRLYGPFSTWFDSKILYILNEMQYLTRGQRLYPNSATAVDQICRFQDKIRIEVDKIDQIAS